MENENHNHRLCVSTLDCHPDTINILYDSLYSRISKHTTKQVCGLLHTQLDTITLRAMYMQIQTSAADCGLFAITTATALCHMESLPAILCGINLKCEPIYSNVL